MNDNNLICEICGSHRLTRISDTEYQCEHCGFTKIINNDSEEHILLVTAHNLLRKYEYIEAEEAFDSIIEKYPKCYDAYWGKLAANYGIVFINDPDSGRIYPTFYDFSTSNFLEEDLYKKFLKLVPDNKKEIYVRLANEIETLRNSYYELVKNEKAYDIFISFKASDDGIDTKDLTKATNINSFLTNKGYKVFFSPVSLADKLARDYEPFIFHALKTAKILLVYGQKEEYFNATWVKNEWGRFYKMKKNDDNKHIIVCYENMLPSKLPPKLRREQALDLNKEFAYVELNDNIGKLINTRDYDTIDEIKVEKKQIKRKNTILRNDVNLYNLDDNKEVVESKDVNIKLEIAKDCLENNDFDEALERYENILKYNPSNAKALLGKILSKNKIKSLDKINVIANNIDIIEEAIKNSSKEDAINVFLNPITKSLINYLNNNSLDNYSYVVYKCLIKFKYDLSSKLNDSILDKCIKEVNYDYFKIAIQYVDSNNIDKHISLRENMQNALIEKRLFDYALELIDETLEIEEGNNVSLYNKLICFIGNDFIVSKMNDEGFKILDTVLSYISDDNRDDYVKDLINKILNQKILKGKSNIYKELLRRIISVDVRTELSYSIAQKLKDNSLFDESIVFYNYYLKDAKQYKELGYEGILLCTYKCENINDLIKQNKDYTKSIEYENVLIFSKESNDTLYKKYFESRAKWKARQEELRKAKLKKKKKIATWLVIVMSLFIFIIFLSQNYINNPNNGTWMVENIEGNKLILSKYTLGKKTGSVELSQKVDYINGDYFYLGEYPQTIKDENVTILNIIDNTNYYLGSDGEKYVKATANPCSSSYTFTNGEKVIKNYEYYFKVEPVKWKILSQNNGEYFIFSDCILNAHRFDSSSNKYDFSEVKTYLNNEMYNEMFSDEQKNIIQNTSFGKLFLLSKAEITNTSYGFSSDEYEYDTARKKQVTDYAVANYAWYYTDEEYLRNGWYWLRTPYNSSWASGVYRVSSLGGVDCCSSVTRDYRGLAPALKITVR